MPTPTQIERECAIALLSMLRYSDQNYMDNTMINLALQFLSKFNAYLIEKNIPVAKP